MSLVAFAIVCGLVEVALAILLVRYCGARRRRIDQAEQRAAFVSQLKVAKDLHDGPLQFLAGLVLRLNMLKVEIHAEGAQPASIDADLDQLLSDIRMEQRDLRRTIESLAGREDDGPSEPSCAVILALLASRWRLDTNLSPRNAGDLIPPDLAQHVNFLLKEAASNAVRHGSATRLGVTVQRAPETLELEIVDDGNGFKMPARSDDNVDEEPRAPMSIEWRVRKLGGRLSVETNSTATRLLISLPLRSPS